MHNELFMPIGIVEEEEFVLVVSPLIGTENAVNFIVQTYTINQVRLSNIWTLLSYTYL